MSCWHFLLCCGNERKHASTETVKYRLPMEIMIHLLSFADDDDALSIVSALGGTIRHDLSVRLMKLQKQLVQNREVYIHLFKRVLTHPHDIVMTKHKHLFNEDGYESFSKYVGICRRSQLSPERKKLIADRLSSMITLRTRFSFPLVDVVRAVDFIQAIHYSRVEGILLDSEYFRITTDLFRVVKRRAIVEGFAPPRAVLEELDRLNSLQIAL